MEYIYRCPYTSGALLFFSETETKKGKGPIQLSGRQPRWTDLHWGRGNNSGWRRGQGLVGEFTVILKHTHTRQINHVWSRSKLLITLPGGPHWWGSKQEGRFPRLICTLRHWLMSFTAVLLQPQALMFCVTEPSDLATDDWTIFYSWRYGFYRYKMDGTRYMISGLLLITETFLTKRSDFKCNYLLLIEKLCVSCDVYYTLYGDCYFINMDIVGSFLLFFMITHSVAAQS